MQVFFWKSIMLQVITAILLLLLLLLAQIIEVCITISGSKYHFVITKKLLHHHNPHPQKIISETLLSVKILIVLFKAELTFFLDMTKIDLGFAEVASHVFWVLGSHVLWANFLTPSCKWG